MPFFLGTNTFLRERYLSLLMHSDAYLQYACTGCGSRLIWGFLSIDSNKHKWIPSWQQIIYIPTITVLHLSIKLLFPQLWYGHMVNSQWYLYKPCPVYIFNTMVFTGMQFRNPDLYLINLQMLMEKKSKIRKLLEIIT